MNVGQWANVAASGLVTVVSAVFAATYTALAPWRRTEIGRHVMAVTGAIGLLGLYTVLIAFWPHGVVAAALRAARVVLLLLLAALLVQRTRLMVRAQRNKTTDRT